MTDVLKFRNTKKLELDDIPLIRGLIACEVSVPEIAEKFEVTNQTIYRIKNGQNWSHITMVAQ